MGVESVARKRWSGPLSSLDQVEVRDQVIIRCLKDAFDALRASIPPEEIAKVVRPHFTHCGMAISLNGSRRFNLTGKDVKELVVPYYWTGLVFSGGNCSPIMVHEHGIVVETRDCCFRDIGPDFCLPLSHDSTEAICRHLNPSYHYVFTNLMPEGDDCCRYIVRRKGLNRDVEDLGELKETIDGLDVTAEELTAMRGGMTAEILLIIAKVLVEVEGTERTLTKLVPISTNTGLGLGKEIDGHLDGGKGPRDHAAEALKIIRSSMGQDGAIELAEDGSITGTTCSCPFQDGPVALCKQYEGLINGVCRSFDPKLEFAYTHMMTRGDPACAWKVSRSRREEKAVPQANAGEDPLHTLKMRFARGEISEGEYLKMRDILQGN
jgi:hypothetical protein